MREIFETTIERLFADLATPAYVMRCEGGEWPADLWAALDESGFSLAGVSEALGGAEASWSDMYVLVRAAGRFSVPAPIGEALLANWLLSKSGLEGRAGALSMAANANLVLDGERVNGTAYSVPWGRNVEEVVAIANSSTGVPHVVLLSRSAASELTLSLNVAGEPRDDLGFNSAQVLAQAPLPNGFDANVLELGGAMLRAAQTAGALHALLDMTANYAGERKQFGKAIGSFQAIQQQLAVFAEQAAAAGIAAEAAFVESRCGLATLTIAAAKISTAEAASVGAGFAHSVHGAIGFTEEYPLHLLTRRLWAWRSEFGSASLWSQRLGVRVCQGGSEGYWPLLTGHGQHSLTRLVSDPV
ncbi:acyl-CoA dehydrogenase [Pseudomonas umsongensis]|jgi:alkylation response protein AidB-like acyl-CoA dehydrogenase|uniref:Acyl-CoA dehydrogenase n=1 Tax=Pseudomonas umsongensis TaxID=198618 RepID=A0ABX4DYX8_9PSED|nr:MULTISPECIES: acyl-CoA dehydrogenase family protein [Pseudomonas]KEX94089.1 acyl-CoA dehydrogenase [Pseudomonas putida]MDP9690487.1 alkylation response protein AidB-like acyl-CoA dehydrogenase [Pseudomonas mohnii]EPA96113.1 acyl-CoA dehydrogenase [Pseudomonas sp. G5(2012)]NWL19368.1 acyl-CoA dehydrogenase [Pseudomonas umsongensis]OXR34590.1 acyl-CoA dehydrogenase [Pseudomonas umsongensis]